jgi:ATP-binding cassette subfamily B multidrug efflux pump
MMGRPEFIFQTEASKPQAVGQTLRRFWRYFRPYRLTLLVVALLVVGSTYLQVTVPELIGQAVDCYLTPATRAASAAPAGAAAPGGAAATNCWYSSLGPQATTPTTCAGSGRSSC